MKIFLSVLGTIIFLTIICLVVIYSGWYEVSASNEDSGIVEWIIKTTKNNSIEFRIEDISVPDLKDSLRIKEGFEHYNEMCVVCHGAPGKEETELSKGLNPPAPYLVKVTDKIDPKELFWITKNGIKMTGMPAWGKTHSDGKIWAIVAFMKILPGMKGDEYEKMESESGMLKKGHHNQNDSDNYSHSHNE